jgi:hypothetical protein
MLQNHEIYVKKKMDQNHGDTNDRHSAHFYDFLMPMAVPNIIVPIAIPRYARAKERAILPAANPSAQLLARRRVA